MNKTFEFNTKDRLELREMFYREQSSMANNFIDRIEQIISERITPEPGESGQSAEDVLDQHYKGYLKRIAFPEQVLAAMTTYASQVCADKDREIEVIQTDWQNKVDGWIMGYRYLEKELSAAKQTIAENDKIINESVEAVSVGLRTMIDRRKKIESLESELDKANESLTVMLRKNDELLNLVRPEVVVPKKREINYDDPIIFQKKDETWNICIDRIKSLNPTLTFTELNHEK